jgi:hypothetical protein
METEAIEDMHAERKKLVDDRRTYKSTVRGKSARTPHRWRRERLTAESIGKALGKACCLKRCLM